MFDWEAIDCGGRRRLPKNWVYKLDDKEREFPTFMRKHLAVLQQLRTGDASTAGACDMNLDAAMQALWQLQCLTEKPSAAPMPEEAHFRTDLGMFRWMSGLIVRFASRYEDRHREPPIACSAKPQGMTDWFGAIPESARRREWKFSDEGIRQTGGIAWRRSYLLFTARTLAGCDRFRGFFGSAVPTQPWREWWVNSVRPGLGPEQQDTIDWHMRITLLEL
jgi:hypothetical protein